LLSHVATVFPIDPPSADPTYVTAITSGPGGNLWFIEQTLTDSPHGGVVIGKVTPAGATTYFPPLSVDAASGGNWITPGPDGNVWFTEGDEIGQITPEGAVTLYSAPTIAPYLTGLTAGPDGNVWFTASPAGSQLYSPTAACVVGRITPTGQITTFPILAGPLGDQVITGPIVQGRDGQLWFAAEIPTGNNSSELDVASVTTSGQITFHPIEKAGDFGNNGNGSGFDLTQGPDGNPWLLVGGLYNAQHTKFVKSEIIRIDPSGQFKRFPIPLASDRQLGSIASGPGDGLYFTIYDHGSPNAPSGVPDATIGKLSTSGRASFTSVPSRDVPADSPAGGMAVGPNAELWYVAGAAGNVWPTIVKRGGNVSV